MVGVGDGVVAVGVDTTVHVKEGSVSKFSAGSSIFSRRSSSSPVISCIIHVSCTRTPVLSRITHVLCKSSPLREKCVPRVSLEKDFTS